MSTQIHKNVVVVGSLIFLFCIFCFSVFGEQAAPLPAPLEPSADWFARARETIQQMEYEVTWQDECVIPNSPAGYHMVNREQNLRLYFYTDGIKVVPRTGDTPAWVFQLGLTDFVSGGDSPNLPIEPFVTEDEHGIEYDHTILTERYENSPKGITHTVIVKQKPIATEALILGATFNDNELTAVLAPDGSSIKFTHEGAPVIEYSLLTALDAAGYEIPVELSLSEIGLRISVDDESALYPLTLNGEIKGLTATEDKTKGLSFLPEWIVEGGQQECFFGWSVSTAGDVNGDDFSDVIVGAFEYDNGQDKEGAVFLYYGSATGLNASPDWMGEGNQQNSAFGYSTATAGDVNGDGYSDIIVGAYYYDDYERNEGAAFVWYGGEAGLGDNGTPANADWEGDSNTSGSLYGMSVATAGDINGDGYSDIIVGAPFYSGDEEDEGRVYVYHGSSTGLSHTPDWTAETNLEVLPTCFGLCVGTAGDVNGDGYSDIIVGSPTYLATGRVFVWYGSATGLGDNGTPTNSDWQAISSQTECYFGYRARTAGDVNGDGYSDIIVGAHMYTNGEEQEGAIFVWHGSDTGMGADGSFANADWKTESNTVNVLFGNAVGTAGDVNGDGYGDIIVGAFNYSGGQSNEGAALAWYGSATGLGNPAMADWWAESNWPLATFGASVSTAGDVDGDGYSDVIIGAPVYSYNYIAEGGAAVFHGSPGGLNPLPGWGAESNQTAGFLGFSVSSAGDVNGDGYADVIVGASGFDSGFTDEGAAFLFHGASNGLSFAPAASLYGGKNNAYFGYSVAYAGDVNGDGYDDVVVGAPGYANGQVGEGGAFVYPGSVAGLSTTWTWSVEGNQANVLMGISVASAGDVNGDGFADVIVGAPNYSYDQTKEGRAYIYHGADCGLSSLANRILEGNKDNALLGSSVGSAGDVNGDGYADVIVGAPGYTNGESEEGVARVFLGSNNGVDGVIHREYEGNQAGAAFGYAVSTAGDVNGDGYSDVIMGAYLYDGTKTDEGQAYAFYGSASGLSSVPDWQTVSGFKYAQYGNAVACAGDVNGDGYADVVVGAWNFTHGETNEGKVYCYLGSASGLDSIPDWEVEGSMADINLGRSISSAGDVNGDGYADVVMGAPGGTNGHNAEGFALLCYGNRRRGVSLNPRQEMLDGSKPLARGNITESTLFSLGVLGRTPYGRGKVKLEWEVKPFGTSFDGTGLEQSALWSDTGVTGTEIREIAGCAGVNMGFHWRARLRYHSAALPFQKFSRWFTMPWNGWQEMDFRTGDSMTNQFDDNAEGWKFAGPVFGFDVPLSGVGIGMIGLSPSNSSNSFSYWYSPDIMIKDALPYHAAWTVGTDCTDVNQTVSFRLRVNQKGTWAAWDHIVNSFLDSAPVYGSFKVYDVGFVPVVTGSGDDNRVTVSFDIMSFNPDDDIDSWIMLEEFRLEEFDFAIVENVVTYDFVSDSEGWVFHGAVPPFDTPTTLVSPGTIAMNPGGSSNAFSYWESPDITVENDIVYRLSAEVESTVIDSDQAVQFRIRANQKGTWSAWGTIINSFLGFAPSYGGPHTYDFFSKPLVTGSSDDDKIIINFDIMSFNPDDDVHSWIMLNKLSLDEIYTGP